MGRKIFVSYKYHDHNVAELPNSYGYPTARDYVDWIEDKLKNETDNIYKGEGNDEDLSDKSVGYIWEHLKDKIYDSTITIVLISPNMKESKRWERSQWIPWEVSYSIKEMTRGGYTSHSNAVLAVVLPDANGKYDYYYLMNGFTIIEENIKNGYIYKANWDFFSKYMDFCIDQALEAKNNTPSYKVRKVV